MTVSAGGRRVRYLQDRKCFDIEHVEVETTASVLLVAAAPDDAVHGSAGAAGVTAVRAASGGASGQRQVAWVTHAVTALRPGAQLYVLRSEAARHVGMEVEERLVER
jgi:3-dehydroquinate synthase II